MKGFNKKIHQIEKKRKKLEKQYKKRLMKLKNEETRWHRKFHTGKW